MLFGNREAGRYMSVCTLCSTEVVYYQMVRGILLCNPCAADFRPIPTKQKREWKRREYADRD